MPEYTYTGPGERFYTEDRDLSGAHLGTVQPGDTREVDKAPDQWWSLAGEQDEDRSEDESGSDDSQDAAPGPSAPQPAPPAVVPPAQ